MIEYEIVKLGGRHEINGEFFSQDVIEIHPLDKFSFNADMANEIYRCIKSVDNDLKGAFPILVFEDGDYLGCVGVLGIVDDENGEEQVILSVDMDVCETANEFCRDCYYCEKSKVVQWSRLMQIVEDNDLLTRVIDFVDMQLEED